MSEARIREIVRQFPENDMKLLLSDPGNLEVLLRLAGTDWLDRLRLDEMSVDGTNYVGADFRHVSSDLVLTVPLKKARGQGSRRLWVTILIEHQSTPDRLIKLRLLDYMTQIWKAQVREWGQTHGSFASVKLHPVLPVVFYTGTYVWEGVGDLADLMDEARVLVGLERHLPAFEPLFVPLPALEGEQLRAAGPFGWVLHLMQQKRASRSTFERLLRESVGHLESLADSDRLRWLELLSYLLALVYHDRPQADRDRLEEAIRRSVEKDPHREEFDMVRESTFDIWTREAAVEALRETLVGQLRQRFGTVPAEVEGVIMQARQLDQLRTWLSRVIPAKGLEEVGIGS